MSWTDPCRNCGEHRADCDCGNWNNYKNINKMKTGIELIAQERQEQITKHKRTPQEDVQYNSKYQLMHAAEQLLFSPNQDVHWPSVNIPQDWDYEIFMKMMHKSYKQRLIVAGALIAAEIDRLNNE